ncbi:Eco29kI family restriction endonuclease [Maritalea myrionectae]|uniref:Eco29kI family restriction endonuclease n=1 Tax=Maritalea myrionectae TaxID=454601 RepID=UPI000480B1F3|nr:Eco29kI family restriction endonuclease [Maritalea myrionectae]
MDRPFNPLEKAHLAESTARALLLRPLEKLPPSEPFEAAGIYAIYYLGKSEFYRGLNNKGEPTPIYVGKADPKGGRQGALGWDTPPGYALHNRLRKHAQSIAAADNLDLSDFRCRYLWVDEAWIRLAERVLIMWFKPVWNLVVDGFGNNDPGSGRYKQARSSWDTLHPGREWAMKCALGRNPIDQIVKKIDTHLEN